MAEQNVLDAPARIEIESDNYNSDDFGGSDMDSGDGIAPGMGQSKSSRRRRRKRKGKVAGEPGGDAPEATGAGDGDSAPAAPTVMEGESLALAAAAAPKTPRAPRRQGKPNAQPGGAQPGGGVQAGSTQGIAPQGGNGGGGTAPQQGAAGAQNGQPAPQSNQGQQGQGQGAGGKRWKKKFRDRERRPGGGRGENPGNDFRAEGGSAPQGGGFQQNGYGQNNGGGSFKRKGKQNGGGGQGPRKERSFVGPMDHSYREANGNFADSPPSTIQLHGSGGFRKGARHHGDNQPIDHSMPRPVPIPENAQTHIYFFIEDLFFTAKIQETARKQGVKVAFLKNDKEALAELTDGDDRDKPALIVFDLNNANAKPLTLIPKLKTKLKKSASIIGFLSHLQGDLKAKAVEAGCDTVMPRAAFSQNLPNLLRRYSAEEGEEINYNQ